MQHVAETRPSSQMEVELQKVLYTFSLISTALSKCTRAAWTVLGLYLQFANNDAVILFITILIKVHS